MVFIPPRPNALNDSMGSVKQIELKTKPEACDCSVCFLFLIQCITHTLAATLPLVCVFPVEGLVVFSTVGYAVTAGAGFVAGATTHPA